MLQLFHYPCHLSNNLIPCFLSHMQKGQQKHKNQNRIKEFNKTIKKTKIIQKVHTITWSLFCVGQHLSIGVSLACSWNTQWYSIGEMLCSFFQQVSLANSFLLSCGTFSLAWTRAGLVNTVIVSYVYISCCVWKTVFLGTSTTSGSYNLSISSST